ncbi:hypothetical protein QQA_1666 [Clostridioides difficile Y343]|nr:hypothetical protein QQA_1666 [Clostridioides difficile Y343]
MVCKFFILRNFSILVLRFILTKWYVNSPDPNPPVDPEFYTN